MPQSHEILVRPLITEKFSGEVESSKVAFQVHVNANKQEIAHEVAKRFKVTVVAVNTSLHKGKPKTQMTKRGRFEGRSSVSKKAIVTLAKGQRIDFFAGTEA
jgi:large subunit ribosomal protein L23